MSDTRNKIDSIHLNLSQKLTTPADVASKTVDLEEITSYVHTNEEVAQYALMIGIDPKKEPELLNIAREGISAPLPDDWCAIQDQEGNIVYQQISTGFCTCDHPLDGFFRQRVMDAKGQIHQSKNICSPTKNSKLEHPPKSSLTLQTVSTTSTNAGVQAEDIKTIYLDLPQPSPVSARNNTEKTTSPINTFKLPASTSFRVNRTAYCDVPSLLKAERTLSSLQSKIREARQHNKPQSTDCLTPADRWFWPNTPKTYNQRRPEISLPRLQASPTSISRHQQHKLVDECSDNENIPPHKSREEEEHEQAEQNDRALSEHFANSMRLGGGGRRTSTLYGLYSPPSVHSGSPEKLGTNGVSQQCSCHHNMELEASGSSVECVSFDANESLRYMLEERSRLQKKLAYLKLTYRAYKLRLASMDSSIRQLCTPSKTMRSDTHSSLQRTQPNLHIKTSVAASPRESAYIDAISNDTDDSSISCRSRRHHRPSVVQPLQSPVSPRRSEVNVFTGHRLHGNHLTTATPVSRRSISASSSRVPNRA